MAAGLVVFVLNDGEGFPAFVGDDEVIELATCLGELQPDRDPTPRVQLEPVL